GGVVSQASPARQASAIEVHGDADQVVSTAEVLRQVRSQAARQASAPTDFLLVDARAPDRFRAENETIDPVGGHVPGALNRFFQLNLDATGRFKPAPQLRTEFEALLAGHPSTEVVHYCGSGVTACHNVLAMAHAGLPGSRLYAGS